MESLLATSVVNQSLKIVSKALRKVFQLVGLGDSALAEGTPSPGPGFLEGW